MVDHISRIPNPGDYFVFDAEKESIIVIRGRDNEVRAFYNVCTHRGSRICLDEEGSKKLLVCPYHAWSFSACLLYTSPSPRDMPRSRMPSSA